MFDPPGSNAYSRLSYESVESAAHSALSRLAAQKAICLYQNRAAATAEMHPSSADEELEDDEDDEEVAAGDKPTTAFWLPSQDKKNTLPLDRGQLAGKPGSVLLAGWMADDGDELFGNYVQRERILRPCQFWGSAMYFDSRQSY